MQVRCPHCRNCLDVVEDDSLAEVACPSCGSQFSFFADETATYQAGATRRVAHFELIDRLGMGHFGTVWKARDTELDRTVAVKIPRKHQLDSEETEQFLREARAAAQLRHPNIVSIHEVGRHDDTVYIVSDYVQGATLSDWLTGQQLTAREAAALCAKIARALEHAHEQGVIHRDLKPGNIMVDLDGEPHIMDFGLAKREAGEITMTVDGKVLGTPAYMPPEQARGEGHHADRRSDVYSLGVVLFQLLTGELPFRGNARMLLVQILNDDPPSPRRLNASIPRDLETITLKCLEKDPQRRYATATALADDLECWLSRKPISARPVTRVERGMKWVRRHPAIAALVGLVLLVSTLGFLAVFSQWQRAESALTQAKTEWKRAELAGHQLSRKAMDEALARQEAENKRREAESSKLEAEKANRTAERNAAILAVERGRSLFEQRVPDSSQGLLWFGKSVEYAGDAAQLHQLAWTNLITWLPYAHSIRHYLPYQGSAEAVLFDPSGRWLATATDEGFVQLWDVARGGQIWSSPKLEEIPMCLAFSPDSSRLLVGFTHDEDYTKKGQGSVRIYDTLTGKPVLEGVPHPRAVRTVAYFPDGQHFLTGCFDKQIRRFSADEGTLASEPIEHSTPAASIAFSPDGRLFAVGGYLQHWQGPASDVAFFDATTLKPTPQTLKHPSTIRQVVWHPSGKQLATAGSDSRVRTWSFPEGALLKTMQHTTGNVSGVAYSPDGRTLVSSGHDYNVRVWNAATGEPVGQPLLQNGFDYAVSFHPDGLSFASGSAHGAKIYDLASLRLPSEHMLQVEAKIHNSAFSADGTVVVVRTERLMPDGKGVPGLQAFDTLTGVPLGPCVEAKAMSWVVAVRGDKQVMAVPCSWERKVGVWRIADGKLLAELPHQDAAVCVAFSHDPQGRMIATGGDDDFARVWDGETFEPITEPLQHEWDVISVDFHPDGKSLVTGTRSLFQVNQWDIETGEELGRYSPGGGAISDLMFTSQGDKYATAEHGTWNVRWYDTITGKPISKPMTHPRNVDRRMDVSTDGTLLATGCEDGRVRLWDVETGLRIGPDFVCGGGVRGVTLIERGDARELVALDVTKTIRRWPLPSFARGDRGRIELWTQLLTGLYFDEFSGMQPLSGKRHTRAKEELTKRGGPPMTLELSPAQRINWHRYTAELAQKEKDHFAAAWHLERWLRLEPKGLDLVKRRNTHLLQLDDWRQASAAFRQIAASEPADPQPLFDCALTAAAAGDWDAYRQCCEELLSKHVPGDDAAAAEKVAWICKFGPQAVADLQQPIKLVEAALADKPNSARFHNTLGTLLYRQGRFEEAIAALEEAVQLRKQGIAADYFALALASYRAGKNEQGRAYQSQAEQGVAQQQVDEQGQPKTLWWSQRAEFSIFRTELKESQP